MDKIGWKLFLVRKKLIGLLTGLLLLANGAGIPSGAGEAVSAAGSEASGSGSAKRAAKAVIADHTSAKLSIIPAEWAQKARESLHIVYGHTSHGSQIIYGMMGLRYFKNEPFIYEKNAPKGSIDLRDNPFGEELDLGNPDGKTWAEKTRTYLGKNPDVNVVLWSWCGQLSNADSAYVRNYLDLMQGLEKDFPGVVFVYMTGHLDGTGPDGTLARANRQIREFCLANNKVLYDFADIESYDPDGTYYGDKLANADCSYDSNGDGVPDRNWAREWQKSHKEDKEWYDCYAAHTEPVNANLKAYAAWWLFARAAGWSGEAGSGAGSGAGIGSGAADYAYYAEKLQVLNLFKGDGKSFDLERAPTRLEGAAMLTRLLGGEKEALGKLYPHPFKDAAGSWGNPYVGYLHKYSLTKGISDSSFGCDLGLDAPGYVTFLLRVLGYSDSPGTGDFDWKSALEKAREVGLLDADYFSILKKEGFSRGHMARLTWLALNHTLKEDTATLLQKLVQSNAIDKKAAAGLYDMEVDRK
jgi:hypothetical protein